MLDRSNPYYRQVELIMQLLPLIAREQMFALKGGTAINLFVRDLPRLSVDIDLTYLPLDDRHSALATIEESLRGIADDIERIIPRASINAVPGVDKHCQKLQVSVSGVTIKIEVSPVLRGAVTKPEARSVSNAIASQFGYVETQLLGRDELYAGKLVAALDRQHPRDLFDVKILLEQEGFSSDLLDLLVIYLISSNRPISELLAPNLLPLQSVFEQQFQGMSQQTVSVADLEQARCQMLENIHARLTENHKAFLLSFKEGQPEWQRLKHPQAADLPAVKWKLQNILSLSSTQREKATRKLEKVLSS